MGGGVQVLYKLLTLASDHHTEPKSQGSHLHRSITCENTAAASFVLPGGSPYGFGGLTVSGLTGALVVLGLLGSGVVTTVNVLCEGLAVVLVVVATVVVETLVNSVTFGSGLSSPSMLSVPVGPQSINPATVVVRPS